MDEQPRCVLVIDDESSIRALICHILEHGGYRVLEASGGRSALALLHDGATVHSIVTDLEMDNGSGGWFLSQIAYDFPRLLARTLVISGDPGGAGAAHLGVRWGCPVLAKPFRAAELVAALREIGGGTPDAG